MKSIIAFMLALSAAACFAAGPTSAEIGSLVDTDSVVTNVDLSETLPSVSSNGQTRLEFEKMRIGNRAVWAADGSEAVTNVTVVAETNVTTIVDGSTNVTVVVDGKTNTVTLVDVVVTEVKATNVTVVVDGTNVVFIEEHTVQGLATNWFGKYTYNVSLLGSPVGQMTVDTRNPSRNTSRDTDDTYFFDYPYTTTWGMWDPFPTVVAKGFPKVAGQFQPWSWLQFNGGQANVISYTSGGTVTNAFQEGTAQNSGGDVVVSLVSKSDPDTYPATYVVPAHYETNVVTHAITNISVVGYVTNFIPREVEIVTDLFVTNITDLVVTNVVDRPVTNVLENAAVYGLPPLVRETGVLVFKPDGSTAPVSRSDPFSVEAMSNAIVAAGVKLTGDAVTARGSVITVVSDSESNVLMSAHESLSGSQRGMIVNDGSGLRIPSLYDVRVGGMVVTNGNGRGAVVGGSSLDAAISDKIATEAPPPGNYVTVSNRAMSAVIDPDYPVVSDTAMGVYASPASYLLGITKGYFRGTDRVTRTLADGTVESGVGNVSLTTNFYRNSWYHIPSNLIVRVTGSVANRGTATYRLRTVDRSDYQIYWDLDSSTEDYSGGDYWRVGYVMGSVISYNLKRGVYIAVDARGNGTVQKAFSWSGTLYSPPVGSEAGFVDSYHSYEADGGYTDFDVRCDVTGESIGTVVYDVSFTGDVSRVNRMNDFDARISSAESAIPAMKASFGTETFMVSNNLHKYDVEIEIIAGATNKYNVFRLYETFDNWATSNSVLTSAGMTFDATTHCLRGRIDTSSVTPGSLYYGYVFAGMNPMYRYQQWEEHVDSIYNIVAVNADPTGSYSGWTGAPGYETLLSATDGGTSVGVSFYFNSTMVKELYVSSQTNHRIRITREIRNTANRYYTDRGEIVAMSDLEMISNRVTALEGHTSWFGTETFMVSNNLHKYRITKVVTPTSRSINNTFHMFETFDNWATSNRVLTKEGAKYHDDVHSIYGLVDHDALPRSGSVIPASAIYAGISDSYQKKSGVITKWYKTYGFAPYRGSFGVNSVSGCPYNNWTSFSSLGVSGTVQLTFTFSVDDVIETYSMTDTNHRIKLIRDLSPVVSYVIEDLGEVLDASSVPVSGGEIVRFGDASHFVTNDSFRAYSYSYSTNNGVVTRTSSEVGKAVVTGVNSKYRLLNGMKVVVDGKE